MLFGILSNGFVLLTFAWLPRVRSSTNHFVISLALADVLMVILNPIFFLLLLYEKVEFETGGNFRFYSEIFCSMTSLISFACISVDRMLAISKPLYHRTLALSRCIKIITTVWVFSAITTLLDYIVSVKEVVDELVLVCCNFCIAFAIPTLITIISYAIIVKVIISRKKKVLQETNYGGSSKHVKRNIKITWKILFVIMPGIAMWCVYWVPEFIHSKNEDEDQFSLSFLQIRSLVPIFAAVVNPVIFVLLTPEFRNYLRRLICRRRPCDLGTMIIRNNTNRTSTVF